MELDITGLETAIEFKLLGYHFVIFQGFFVILVASCVLILLACMLRLAVARQNMLKKPSPILIIAESLWKFSGGALEELQGSRYRKGLNVFAANLFLLLMFINTAGIWGLHPPASNVFIAFSLGIVVALTVHGVGLSVGLKHYLKTYIHPNWFFLPINLIETFAQIISISMRLFGNMLAGIVLIQLLSMLLRLSPIALGIFYPTFGGLLTMYSDLFIATIQSFIFMTLTLSYIKAKLIAE